MPAGLTPQMRSTWKAIVADLRANDALDPADAAYIEALAVMWGRAREARAELNRQAELFDKGHRELPPLLEKTERGTTANPLLAVERESLKELRLVAEWLPLSSRARRKLGLEERRDESLSQARARIGRPRLVKSG